MFSNPLCVDPRTKLILLLTLNIVLLSFGTNADLDVLRFIVGFFPFVMLLTARRYKWALSYGVFYALCHMLNVFVLPHTTGFLMMLVGFVVSVGTRFVPGGMMGVYFLCSTKVNEFTEAMQRMKVPQKITIPLSVMFRFFPTVYEESHDISDAMRMRKLGFKYFFLLPVEILEYRLVPLMMSVVTIGEDLSASALTRCLGYKDTRTNISQIGFTVIDAVIATVCLLTVAVYVCVRQGIL